MAKIKCTMLFQSRSNFSGTRKNARIGGWSESVYGEPGSLLQTVFLRLCEKRAACLPIATSIIGQRYQQVDPVGSSQTGRVVFPGTAGLQADIPQASLLVRMPSSDYPNFRPYYMRGLPDSQIEEGEYDPSLAFKGAIERFLTQLSFWKFKALDVTETTVPIISIDATGTVLLGDNLSIAPKSVVKVLRTTNADGRQVGGVFRFNTVASPTSGTLYEWNNGDCVDGKMRLNVVVYPTYKDTQFGEPIVVTRKVGRSFNGYRGRASRKR